MSASTVALDKLFAIDHGNKLDLNKMESCDAEEEGIIFVNRSASNNGIVGVVKRISTISPYPAGSITVALGGSALASFVQPREFYTAQNIDVLRPLTQMNDEVKWYYCLCIEANRYRYSTFGREANRTLRTILVPPLSLIPTWVHGATIRAAQSIGQDMSAFVANA